MYKILAAIDMDEERAVHQAQTIADMPQAEGEIEVYLMHTYPEGASSQKIDDLMHTFPEGPSAEQIESVRRASDILDDQGISYQLLEKRGDLSKAILEKADEVEASLICISGRKQTPVGKALFGSVAQAVILNTSRPVLFATEPEM